MGIDDKELVKEKQYLEVVENITKKKISNLQKTIRNEKGDITSKSEMRFHKKTI